MQLASYVPCAKCAYSLLNALPMTILRISDVPAPISYSFALSQEPWLVERIIGRDRTGYTHSLRILDAGISST